MAHPSLFLEGVSQSLPDGRLLFPPITTSFGAVPTGLVGANGVGKSVLARILADQLAPSSGRRICNGRVHYLAQQVGCAPDESVASLAGVAQVLAALRRIEDGSCDPADYARVGDDWDIGQRLAIELERQGLAGLDPHTPAARLSGGEAMRVALAGAWLAQPDVLILDEPSNHLDQRHRRQLMTQLAQWPCGLLVVSHDRALLDGMQRIVELSAHGLYDHPGNHASYLLAREQDRDASAALLEQRRLERRRGEQALREQRERQQRRNAQATRERRDANQAPILLDRQKERSQGSAGRLQRQLDARGAQLDARVREATQQLLPEVEITLLAPQPDCLARRRAAVMEQLVLAHADGCRPPLDLVIGGARRIALTGDNGCGKSTLLRTLAGQLPAHSGRCEVLVDFALLDQRLQLLDPALPVLPQLRAANPQAGEAQLRTRLALLGLDAERIDVASGQLSGGERLKAALACLLYAARPPQLLLLDEPDNHLDLASQQSLERMLRAYPGALLVSSHDEVFLGRLQLHERLQLQRDGWRHGAWRPAPDW